MICLSLKQHKFRTLHKMYNLFAGSKSGVKWTQILKVLVENNLTVLSCNGSILSRKTFYVTLRSAVTPVLYENHESTATGQESIPFFQKTLFFHLSKRFQKWEGRGSVIHFTVHGTIKGTKGFSFWTNELFNCATVENFIG